MRLAVRQEGLALCVSDKRTLVLSVRVEAPDPDLQVVSTPDSRRRLTGGGANYSREGGNFSAVTVQENPTRFEHHVCVKGSIRSGSYTGIRG